MYCGPLGRVMIFSESPVDYELGLCATLLYSSIDCTAFLKHYPWPSASAHASIAAHMRSSWSVISLIDLVQLEWWNILFLPIYASNASPVIIHVFPYLWNDIIWKHAPKRSKSLIQFPWWVSWNLWAHLSSSIVLTDHYRHSSHRHAVLLSFGPEKTRHTMNLVWRWIIAIVMILIMIGIVQFLFYFLVNFVVVFYFCLPGSGLTLVGTQSYLCRCVLVCLGMFCTH